MANKGRIHFHDGTYIDVGETPVVKDEDWPAHLAEWSHRIAEEEERLIVAIRAYKYPSNDEENTAICQEILFWLREFERSRDSVLKRLKGVSA